MTQRQPGFLADALKARTLLPFLSLCVLALGVGLVCVPGGIPNEYGFSLAKAVFAIGAVSLFIATVALTGVPLVRLRKNPLLAPLGLFSAGALLATGERLFTPEFADVALGWLLGVLLLLLLPGLFRRREIDYLLFFFLLSAILGGIQAMFQFYGVDFFFLSLRDYFTSRWVPHGFFANSALFAGYSTAILPFTWYAILHARLGIVKIFSILGFILVLVASICTHTRSVLIAFVLGVILFCLSMLWRNFALVKRQLPLLFGVFLGLAFILTPFIQKNPGIPRTVANPERFFGRSNAHWLFWQTCLVAFGESGLRGAGLNAFPRVYLDAAAREASRSDDAPPPPYRDVHNEYLSLLLETGVLGLLGFVWLLVVYCRAVWRRLGRDNSSRDKTLLLCTSVSLFLILFQAAFSYTLHSIPHLVLAAVLVSIGVADWRPYTGGNAQSETSF